MSTNFNRGDVDYDYDMYKNRIRKYVVTDFTGKGKERKPVWIRVDGFDPERGFNNLNRFSEGSYFSEAPSEKTKKVKNDKNT